MNTSRYRAGSLAMRGIVVRRLVGATKHGNQIQILDLLMPALRLPARLL